MAYRSSHGLLSCSRHLSGQLRHQKTGVLAYKTLDYVFSFKAYHFLNIRKPLLCASTLCFPDKPDAVVFSVENSTAVRLSWSGSVNLSTFVRYTVHCSLSGVIMSVNERVLPPGVDSTVVVLDDDITLTDVYVHNFTLYYIIRNDVTSPQTTAVFTFGTISTHHTLTVHDSSFFSSSHR